jgi:hypothetical protein
MLLTGQFDGHNLMILGDLATTHMLVAFANIWFQLKQLQDMDYLSWVQITVCFFNFLLEHQ